MLWRIKPGKMKQIYVDKNKCVQSIINSFPSIYTYFCQHLSFHFFALNDTHTPSNTVDLRALFTADSQMVVNLENWSFSYLPPLTQQLFS